MFLATTAIEEFWDKNQKIVFLGEWCKLYNRKEVWSNLDYEEIPFIWDNTAKVEKAIIYCDEIYEKTLAELTTIINNIHNIKEETKYYRIILGNWLYHFIHQAYDKYLTLKVAFAKYDGLSTYCLDASQYYVPTDMYDYLIKLFEDEYNLQLYSQIIDALNFSFPTKKMELPLITQKSYKINSKVKQKAYINFIYRLICFLSNILYNNSTVTIIDPGFGPDAMKKITKILIRSRLRIIYDKMNYPIDIDFDLSENLRSKIKLTLDTNEFERVLSSLLFKNLPILFLEGFQPFNNRACSLPIKKSKVFFSNRSIHNNYIYKFYIAKHYKEIKILSAQHGGGYGVEHLQSNERYERSISDVFYTWGWLSNNKTKVLPSPTLNKNLINKKNNDKQILFIQDSASRYLYRLQFHYLSSSTLYNFNSETLMFLRNIDRNINMLIRLYPFEFKWNIKERIIDSGVKFEFDDYSLSFDQRMAESYICVLDHLSTSYLEILVINKPTIIFINPLIYKFNKSAQPYFNKLVEAKILHYSPLTAATHFNEVRYNVYDWWNSPLAQKAKDEFIYNYARTSNDWISQWVREFNSVLK